VLPNFLTLETAQASPQLFVSFAHSRGEAEVGGGTANSICHSAAFVHSVVLARGLAVSRDVIFAQIAIEVVGLFGEVGNEFGCSPGTYRHQIQRLRTAA